MTGRYQWASRLVQASERERDGVGFVEFEAAVIGQASQAQHHALDLLLGGVTTAGQTLLHGGGGEREDGDMCLFDDEADYAAHVSHEQGTSGMFEGRKHFFQGHEVRLVL